MRQPTVIGQHIQGDVATRASRVMGNPRGRHTMGDIPVGLRDKPVLTAIWRRMKMRPLRQWIISGIPQVARGCLLAAVAATASPASAQNVSVTDYKVPVSRADNLRIDALSFNYVTEGEEEIVKSGNLGVVYKKFYESLPFAYKINLNGIASFSKDNLQDKLTGDFRTTLSAELQKYARAEGNVFVFGGSTFDADDDSDRPSMDLTVGFGYGRFINATPLRKAVRIEDFLLKEGIISDHLPKETMITLGQTIEKEQEYQDLYGDRAYLNYWYEDMGNEITKSGLVLGSIGPIGVLRMQEVIAQERINDRFYGWEATAGVKFEAITPRKGQVRRDPAMSIGLRYSRPVSWRTQVNTDLKLDTPFSERFGRSYILEQETDFVYEITNRISFTVFHTFRVDKVQGQDARYRTNLLSAFNFFLENKVNLATSWQVTKFEGDPLRQSINLALSYRIF